MTSDFIPCYVCCHGQVMTIWDEGSHLQRAANETNDMDRYNDLIATNYSLMFPPNRIKVQGKKSGKQSSCSCSLSN